MSNIIGDVASATIDGQITPNVEIQGAIYPKGDTGDPGNGIKKIEYTSSSENVDTYTITFDDDTTTTFTVTNGTNGVDGKGLEFNWQGTQLGIRVEGTQEYTYIELKGQDGYTPVKGTDYFTPTEIADIESDIIGQIDTLKKEVVQILPVSDIDPNTIYLVPKQSAAQGDVYDEYLYINNQWEHIGSTEVDLTNYYTKQQTYNKTEVDNLLDAVEGNEVYISDDDSDIPESAKIFIDESEGTDAYSEVVNSLSGNEIAKAPSVRAVNEALNGTILYESSTQVTTGNIDLNDDITNYKYLEIFYRENNGRYSSVKVETTINRIVDISLLHSENNALYMKQKSITLKQNYIEQTSFLTGVISSSGIASTNTGNTISIMKVIGYK